MRSRSLLAKPVYGHVAALLGLLLLAPTASAQSTSHDGHRWYEIELLVFSQRALPSDSSESQPSHALELGYPARTTVLRSLMDTLRVDFPLPTAMSSPLSPESLPLSPAPDETVFGPPTKVEHRAVRLPDLTRDPFLLQGAPSRDFQRHQQRLQQSGNYRPLFHGRWRQPLLSKNQATAIALSAGERYGDHSELEGHVTLSLNGNRVHIDARLWQLGFSAENLSDDDTWRVPVSPVILAEKPTSNSVEAPAVGERSSRRSRRQPREAETLPPIGRESMPYKVVHVDLLEETRAMVSHALHYLDHPSLGVLVEVRPYTLPEPPGGR